MQLVHDLMDAYTEHIGLPLALLNLEGEIEYEKNSFSKVAKKDCRDLIRLGNDIKFSTIISQSREHSIGEVFYMISHFFTIQEKRYMLIAGPYALKQTALNCVQTNEQFVIKDATEVEKMMNRFNNLLFIFTAKNEVESNVLISKEIADLFYLFDDLSSEELSEKELLEKIVQKLFQLKGIDFVGYAQKITHNMYEIRFIIGNNMKLLHEKRFYYGEGLLGQAFMQKKNFFWEKKDCIPHSEFFERHQIFPEQLFGIPLLKEDYSETIIFGGSFLTGQLQPTDMYLLNNVIVLMTQKKQVNVQLAILQKHQAKFKEWMLFLDLIYEYKNQPMLALKLLDFCEILNDTGPCYLTTNQGQRLLRNHKDQSILEKHTRFETINKTKGYVVQQEEAYVHFYIERFGSYTIDFSRKFSYYNETIIIISTLKLLQFLDSVSQAEHTEKIPNLIEHYYLAMEEMNIEKFKKAKIAIQFVEIASERNILNQFTYKALVNLCKILPYSCEFIQRQMGQSYELSMLNEMILLSTSKMNIVPFEYKIITFIDREILKEDRFKGGQLTQAEAIQLEEILKEAISRLSHEPYFELTLPVVEEPLTVESLGMATKPFHITKRENDVMLLLIDGFSNQEIANRLNISAHTVKNHITNIYKKLEVVDRYHAIKKVLNF